MNSAMPPDPRQPEDRNPGLRSESEGEQALLFLAQSALAGL